MSKSLIAAVMLLVVVLSVLVVITVNTSNVSPKTIPVVDLSNIRAIGVPTVDQSDPLDRGKIAYYTFCAHCHGYNGDGEAPEIDPSLPDTLGFMPVPRHDNKGHTWMHPDRLIVAAVRQGLSNPLFRYPMPAFSAKSLSDQQMADILLFMKQWWTPEQRAAQAALSQRYDEAQNRSLPTTP